MEKIRRERGLDFVRIFCIILCAVLAYKWQRTFFAVCVGDIYSDVPLHIELALGRNDYGLSSYIIRALYAMFSEHRAQTVLSLILAANNVLAIFMLTVLVCYLLPGLNRWYALLAAELALICGPWLIPGYQTAVYLGAHNGNLYHNMTVLFSRTLIPVNFIFFCRCWDEIHGKIKAADWLLFMGSFLLITMFKPNFAFAFIPMLGVMLIVDFIKSRGKNLKNEIIMGMCVVPAGLTCIWQFFVLYDDSFAGTSSGIALRKYNVMSFLAIIIVYLRGLLLPLYTLVLEGRKTESRGHIRHILICEAVALAESTILVETGFRATDGNFDWGGLALYPTMFALGIGLLFMMIKKADFRKGSDTAKCAVGAVLLIGHLLIGVYFLYAFNHGFSYFI